MKFENENIVGTVAMCTFIVLVLASVVCVMAGSIKAAVIVFVPAMLCGLVSNAFAIEDEIAEYYYYEEDELD